MHVLCRSALFSALLLSEANAFRVVPIITRCCGPTPAARSVHVHAAVPRPTESSSTLMSWLHKVRHSSFSAVLALSLLLAPSAALADGQTLKFKLPPIDNADQQRCTLQGSKMGQANAARDKLYDLRECQLPNAKASGYDLSGVIMGNTDVRGADFTYGTFSKAYLRDSNFDGADFTNAIIDRATFQGSSLRNAIFTNAVLTGTSFEKADLEGTDFTEASFGLYDARKICQNPTLTGTNSKTSADTARSAGCAGS